MRSPHQTFTALALAAFVTLVPAAAASAKKPKPAAWAKTNHLSGSWRAKDADRDGVKNLAEYKLGTKPRKADSDKDGLKDGDELLSANNPLKADTDGDGIKDGAEHAGVVTAFDGETVTIRQFKGPKLTLTLDDCDNPIADASGGSDDDETSDEDLGVADASEDGDWSDDGSADDVTADSSAEEDDVALGDDEGGASCDFDDVEVGTVFTSAELDTSGGVTYLVAVEIA
jgi:hypothetical protein